MSIDPEHFRQAMRCLAGAVTIVATEDGGKRSGLTATAVCSFSMTPPSLLACLNVRGATYRLIDNSRRMSVNLLARDQEHLARRFAGQIGTAVDDHFAHAQWSNLATGAPILMGTLASFDCHVKEIIVATTHAIVIGEVEDVILGSPVQPLLYLDGRFTSVESMPMERES